MRYVVIIFVLLLWPMIASALPMQDFGRLPILHEGRVKPISSFASHFFAEDSLSQLASSLFTPQQMKDKPIFAVTSKSVRQILALEEKEKGDHYSYDELAPAFDAIRPVLLYLGSKKPETFSSNEKALWRLYGQVESLAQILRSFTWALPLEHSEGNYLSQRDQRADLKQKLKKIAAQKGEDLSRYTPKEKRLAEQSLELTSLALIGKDNELLKLLPFKENLYVSPWQVIEGGKGSPQAGQAMQQWQQLMQAYRKNDEKQWQAAISSLKVYNWRLSIEGWYHAWPWAALIAALYITALFVPMPIFQLALSAHALLIIARIIILQRPPVSTLYESVLFVALGGALFAYLMWRQQRHLAWLRCGAVIGGGLLLASGLYASPGDNMGVLIAVLNTNIWLATHVMCITLGYAAALLAGTMAHLALWRDSMSRYLPLLAVFALLLTAVGTMLGGVWADQSWGRFWGWDPKENGALLLVLWLAWVLHGRLSVHFKARSFSAMLALTNIVVAISWFGVNLLNTGLHSYGFTESAAIGLAVFCAIELLLIFVLYIYPQFLSRKAE